MKSCLVSMPRSRTAWLAAWLGVEHEPLSRLDSLDDAPECVVDTASAVLFNGLFTRWPKARYVFVFRDLGDVIASCKRVGFPTQGLVKARAMQNRAFDSVKHLDSVISVSFDRLSEIETLQTIWTHLGRGEFDAERAGAMAKQNIQADDLFPSVDPVRAQTLMAESGYSSQGAR